MNLDLYDVGSRLFGFYLSLIIVTTLMGTVLLATGAPDEVFNIPIFAPAKMFFDMVVKVYQNTPLPTNVTNGTAYWVVTSDNTNVLTQLLPLAISVYIIAQLLVSALSGYIGLAITLTLFIRSAIPELDFLTYPLIFITSFFQLAVFYYIAMRIKDMISPYISYR